MHRIPSTTILTLSLFVALWMTGCGQSNAPTRYKLSGEISIAGQPIPNGVIVFTPDSSQGNSGPQGVAIIKDGKYDTAAPEGKGIGGGPTIIRVTGQGEESQQLICEFEEKADLPKEDAERKIDVPATAVNRKPPSPEV